MHLINALITCAVHRTTGFFHFGLDMLGDAVLQNDRHRCASERSTLMVGYCWGHSRSGPLAIEKPHLIESCSPFNSMRKRYAQTVSSPHWETPLVNTPSWRCSIGNQLWQHHWLPCLSQPAPISNGCARTVPPHLIDALVQCLPVLQEP